MGTASFQIAGRRYELPCRDGEERRFQDLARIVDAKAVAAVGSGSGVNEARQLLFASLLLADELQELRNGGKPAVAAVAPTPPPPDPTIGKVLDTVAARIETLAARLEKAGATS